MSNIALSWAFRCHVGNASAKAVLVYLADRADDDGTAAYPKIATIVNVTELSERTVRAALKTLQERGFIRRHDGGGGGVHGIAHGLRVAFRGMRLPDPFEGRRVGFDREVPHDLAILRLA